MSRDHEHQESKAGGKRKKKKRQASKYSQQHAWSSAEFMFISESALQVLWPVGDPAHSQSLSRERDLVLLKFHSWCQHWTQHKLPMTEARITNQVFYPLENKASFRKNHSGFCLQAFFRSFALTPDFLEIGVKRKSHIQLHTTAPTNGELKLE